MRGPGGGRLRRGNDKRAAVEAMAGHLTAKPLTTPLAMAEADRLRESVARLFNCSADHLALTRSTAHGNTEGEIAAIEVLSPQAVQP